MESTSDHVGVQLKVTNKKKLFLNTCNNIGQLPVSPVRYTLPVSFLMFPTCTVKKTMLEVRGWGVRK